MSIRSPELLRGVRWFAGGLVTIYCGNYVYNSVNSRYLRVVRSPAMSSSSAEDPTTRRLQLLKKAEDEFGPADDFDIDFQPDPAIRDCMRQYQKDHPQGYKLWDAIEHCDCQLPKGINPAKLKGLFVRNEDNVSEQLNEVELRMMGVKTRTLLPYHEARRLRQPSLPAGIDPNKPRNFILEAALDTTPRDGPYEELSMRMYWDSRDWKIGSLKYGSLWERDTYGG